MRMSYRIQEPDEQVKALAGNLVQIILDSGCTYQRAEDALTEAQRMLLELTVPSLRR